MRISKHRWVRGAAVMQLCVFSYFHSMPSLAASAVGSELAALSQLASAIPPTLGVSTASIANGQKDQAEGQQMQNMAQVAQGAMQIAQGLLGMMAAAAEADKANTASNRADGLSGLNGYTPSNYDPTKGNGSTNTAAATGSSNTGAAPPSTSTIGISPEALRNGVLGKAMDGIEKNFGIPRDKFAEALRAGVNPKDLLANAPKNPQSMDLLNRIEAKLAAGNTGAKEVADRILASVGGGASNPSLASAETPVETAKGVKPVAPPPAVEEEADLNNPALSPEIKAAMAAKVAKLKAEQEMRDSHGWSIFQLVHNRYQKLETMLYGRVERTNPNPSNVIRQ